MQILIIILGLAMLDWGAYQLDRGEAYAHTGRTRFSPVDWIPRESDKAKFWGTVSGQFLCGVFLIVAAFAKF